MGMVLEEDVIIEMKKDNKYIEKINNYYRELVDIVHKLRGKVFIHNNTSNVNYPINMFRLINQTISLFSIEKEDLSDISPIEIIDSINELNSELKSSNMDEIDFILKALIYSYLSPKNDD